MYNFGLHSIYVLLQEKQTQTTKTKVRVVIHPDSETACILTCGYNIT